MKVRILIVLGLLAICTACASIKPATATEADRASAYMYQVEEANRGRATRVIWVNPPRNKDLEDKD